MIYKLSKANFKTHLSYKAFFIESDKKKQPLNPKNDFV